VKAENGEHTGEGAPRVFEREGILDRHLAAYVLAAGVAVSTHPAHAEIVFTRANLSLLNGFYAIDFNHDGVSDFSLHAYLSGDSSSNYNDLLKVGARGAASVIGLEKGNALSAWDAPLDWSIGPDSPRPFINIDHRSALMLAIGPKFNPPRGPWKNVTNRFLGLKFLINGETHYGWARLTVTTAHGVINATLTGYAYETTPGQAILAGDRGPAAKPAVETLDFATPGPSLGDLSRGAASLDVLRHRSSDPLKPAQPSLI